MSIDPSTTDDQVYTHKGMYNNYTAKKIQSDLVKNLQTVHQNLMIVKC